VFAGDQISFAARLKRNHLIQLEPGNHLQDRFDMAMGKSLLGGEQILR
jgi:hypothetical protein